MASSLPRITVDDEQPLRGLTSGEAAERLRVDGPNLLPQEEPRASLRIVIDVMREPMFLLLLAATALYVVLGDLTEASALGFAVIAVIGINVLQQGRTERALAELRSLSTPRAQVLRDGDVVTLAARELVRGDIIRVAEGDRVPADARLLTGTVLMVDESALTGESVAVTKLPASAAAELDDGSHADAATPADALFLGTLVVSGRGTAEVTLTGPRTALGKIGASLGAIESEQTPLQREVRKLVRRMAALGLLVAGAVVAGFGLRDGQWVAAALAGITVAMSLLPEEFPVVLTVFLALGAKRLVRERVLTRSPMAIEALGGVHSLCTDKTGTLTQNRMTIRRLCTREADHEVPLEGGSIELPESVHTLVEVGILACPRDPFDPMEKAFHELGRQALDETEHLHPDWGAVHEYPLSSSLLAVAHVWKSPERAGLFVATKGAPEAVFDLCHLDESSLLEWRRRVDGLAQAGLRVLGVGRSRSPVLKPLSHPHDVDFEFVGLVGLHDPLQPGVRDAITQCREAGIRVTMITGDHPATARAIAVEAGIDGSRVLTGAEIDALDDAALREALGRACVVARARPEHKLRIVRAEQTAGRVVGMTGDGVNDAPALKAADVGVAMGMRGTAVAREASDIVLTHDDFNAIVSAVRLGRRIYDNLKKAFAYIVAVHVPIAGAALLPALAGLPPLLLPAHVMFLELVIDPACSVVFELEPEEPGIMRRPPRAVTSGLLSTRALAWSMFQGALVLSAVLFLGFARPARSAEALRALCFVALVAGNLAILLTARTARQPFWRGLGRRSLAPLALIGSAVVATVLTLWVPALRDVFSFARVEWSDVALWAGAGALPVLALDARKALGQRPD